MALTPTPPAPAAATPAADVRRNLVTLREAGRRYRFLDLGYRYLAAVDRDPEIALELLKALVEIGLGGPARELLHARKDLTAAVDDARLRRSLAGVPIGRVPWERLAARFESNLEALLDGRPHLEPLAMPLRDALDGYQLFQSNDDLLHLSRREPGRLRAWLPALTDHAEVTEARPAPEILKGPILIVGLHLNDFIEHVWSATTAPAGAQKPPLALVDPNLYTLAAWLRVADRRRILEDPRVLVFAGADADTEYRRYLISAADVDIPHARLGCYAPDDVCRRFDEAGRCAHREREQLFVAAAHRLRDRAATRRARLEPGARVLGFTSRFSTMVQYSMRDIGAALETLGYRFRFVMETADHRRSNGLVVAREVEAFDPDLIVLINHFRHELPEPMVGVPVLTWVQDPTDVVFSKKTGTTLGPLDFVCGYYRKRCTESFGYPPSRYFYAPVPVSTRVFHDGPVPEADRGRYGCDLMYVGHLHQDVEALRERFRAATPAHLHPLLDRIHQEVTTRHARGDHDVPWQLDTLVRGLADELLLSIDAAALEHLTNFFARRLFDSLYRIQTLEWAARWAERNGRTFRLYGRGWNEHPILRTHAAGPVEHGEPLRRAYRGATLTLQTMPITFTHQRVFESLISGSLVLGRYVPRDFDERGAAGRFPKLDRVVFRDAAELAGMAERWLDDAAGRRALQAEFAAVVHETSTYDAVLPPVIEAMGRELANA